MYKKLDLDNIVNTNIPIEVGLISARIVDIIKKSSHPIKDYIKESKIILWTSRVEYTEKHKYNFENADKFYSYVADIPNIIENADYIGINPKDSSIQFIKRYSDLVLVAVRINLDGKASYRTMYPITEGQLNDYIKKNKAWKLK